MRRLQHELRLYGLMLRDQYRDQMTMGWAFVVEVTLVTCINFMMAIAWVGVFLVFGNIRGWYIPEYLGAFGVSMLVFGSVNMLAYGVAYLPYIVSSGEFEHMLRQPISTYTQIATYRVDTTAPTDTMLGLGVVVWFGLQTEWSVGKLAMFLLALLIAVLVFWSFVVMLPNIVAAFVRDGTRLGFLLSTFTMDGSSSPTGVLTGSSRAFFLYGLPVLYIAVVPFQVLTQNFYHVVWWGLPIVLCWVPVCVWLLHYFERRFTPRQ